MNRVPYILIALLSLLSSAASATVISGRVGVSSYLWEKSEVDSSDTQHWQNTGTLGLRLWRIGDQDLEVATTLRGRYDSRSQGDNVDDYRVYDLVARWRKIAGHADIAIGRHRMSWPNASVAIDGGSADIRLLRGFEIGGYIGSLAPDDGRFKSVDFDSGHAVGGRVGIRSKPVGTVFASFAETRRFRRYGDTEVRSLATRTFGLDWRKAITGFGSLYGHVLYDGPRRNINRAHFSARWSVTPTVTLNGQIRYRRPSLPYNSIFWVFGESEYTEGRLRAFIRLNELWTLTVGGAVVEVTDEKAQRFDLGVAHQYFSVMVHGKSGESGTTTALSGDVMYPLNDKWTVRGGSHYSKYELYEDQAEGNTEGSVWAGVRWQWMPMSTWDLEAQFLAQDITTDDTFTGDESNFRIIARFSWWFFRRLGGNDQATKTSEAGQP